jgi:hypothetical protein
MESPPTDSALVEAARRWVYDRYPYNRVHLLRSLEWLDEVAPGSSEAMRIATVTHDMERAFPGPDQPTMTSLVDPEYDRAHAERSARVVGAWLREAGVAAGLVTGVEALVRAHEVGGWPEADLVQAADSLSFLDTNVELMLGFARSGRFSVDNVRRKLSHMRDRIRIPELRALAEPLAVTALARLDELGDALDPTDQQERP